MRRFNRRKRIQPSVKGDRRDARPALKRLSSIGIWLVAVVVVGCRSPRLETAAGAEKNSERAAIEARALQVFTGAILLKPREDMPAANLEFKLAPLMIQEVTDAKAVSNGGPATVFHQLGAVQVAGQTRPQMTYLWSGGNDERLTRGVRLTLDARGFPVIWEALDDRPGPRVCFVAKSLEEKARLTFGAPPAGRRFAVEQPSDVAPEAVVARVIEDGPVAMGPIVHQAASGEITAVICRCMSTQARQLVGTKYYELKPLSAANHVEGDGRETHRPLAEQLRLPPGF